MFGTLRLAERRRITRIRLLGPKRLLLAGWRRRGLNKGLVRVATFRLRPPGLRIGGCHRTRRPVQVSFAIGIHDAEIVLGVLVEILGRDPVAAGRCLARQSHIAFENLISVAADFYIWTIAVEGLNSVRHPRAVVMRVAPIAATTRSLVWSWSHDTCLIVVNTVGPMSGGSVPRPLAGSCGPVCAAFPDDGEPPSEPTLDGKAAHSNNFLRHQPRRASHDATRDPGKIVHASLDCQPTRPQNLLYGRRPTNPDLARNDASRL